MSHKSNFGHSWNLRCRDMLSSYHCEFYVQPGPCAVLQSWQIVQGKQEGGLERAGVGQGRNLHPLVGTSALLRRSEKLAGSQAQAAAALLAPWLMLFTAALVPRRHHTCQPTPLFILCSSSSGRCLNRSPISSLRHVLRISLTSSHSEVETSYLRLFSLCTYIFHSLRAQFSF